MLRLLSIVIALPVLLLAGVTNAQPRRPLALEGKTALYQRVIAVPGAVLNAAPGDAEALAAVTPFSVLYVYERRTAGGREWLQVGTGDSGSIDGWLDAAQGIEWKQALTVSFKDPAVQPRVLLYQDRESARRLIGAGDLNAYRQLYQQTVEGVRADSPVIAIQPEAFINIRRNFYLVPILDHEDILLGAHQGRLLHVATVPLDDPSSGFRTGVVFVIDTTISMGPYIEVLRSTMQRVYQSVEDAGLAGQVNFGLVAYRDNTTAVPGLEYATRLYVSPAEADSGAVFQAGIRDVQPAPVSSQGYNEDAYAGIKQAIDDIDWEGFNARYLILITDAGPRISGDNLATTGLDTDSLRRLAADHSIAIMVMHLRTPEGAANHDFAGEQYRRLSDIPDIGNLYYPVETGNVDSYEQALAAMSRQLTAQTGAAGPAPEAAPVPAAAAPGTPEQLAELQNRVAKLGYALRMRYLSGAGRRVPRLFDAWLVDRNMEAPEQQSVDVRVLLNRDQLSDLYEVLRRVLATAEEGALAPQDFLNELKSLAATISRDPQAAKTSTRSDGSASLADLGYMREYIEGLPYTSQVMDLDLSTWQQWPAQRQFEFINSLDGKIAYYRALHNNLDLWVSLDGGPVDGDSVYPLLLEALP